MVCPQATSYMKNMRHIQSVNPRALPESGQSRSWLPSNTSMHHVKVQENDETGIKLGRQKVHEYMRMHVMGRLGADRCLSSKEQGLRSG